MGGIVRGWPPAMPPGEQVSRLGVSPEPTAMADVGETPPFQDNFQDNVWSVWIVVASQVIAFQAVGLGGGNRRSPNPGDQSPQPREGL